MIKKIKEYILNEYGVNAEMPFKDDESIVFRNASNKKWFAIIMQISASKLGLNSDELVKIINVKNSPENVFMLRGVDGIFPAYHMNKENWLTILLNGKIPLGMVFDLITQSYEIIDLKR